MITPGQGSSKYRVGETLTDDIVQELQLKKRGIRGDIVVYKSDFIWFFVNSESDKIEQITFFKGWDEKLLDKIAVGDALDYVLDVLGKCQIIDGAYEPQEYDGLSFDVMKDDRGLEYLSAISVYDPYLFKGTLPDHIARNIQMQKRRKLP